MLEDTITVADIGFDSAKFVVVMISKKKVPEAAPSTEAAAEPVVAAPEPVEAAPVAAAVVEPEAAPVDAPAAEPEAVEAPDDLTAEQEAAVLSLMEIGSERDKAIAVLRAAFWNADRAVEYLFNGIPDNVVGEEAPARGRRSRNRAGQFGNSVQDHMNAVANMPQLDQIRAILRENPEMLEEVLDEIAAIDPAIVETIQNNQQAFMDILNGTGDAGRQRRDSLERRRNEVQANQEEAAAIRRIKAIVVNAPEALVVEVSI